MPEFGQYEKMPRPESISKFIDYLENHDKVQAVE